MNRQRADSIVALLVALVVLIGGALTWEAFRQRRIFGEMGSMMGTTMGAVHGTNPLWYVLGTLLVLSAIGGSYLAVRETLTETESGPGREDVGSAPAPHRSADAGSVEPQPRMLDFLPEDERRVLEPVVSSPGITQIELRDRSDFSKSKISQTVSSLEKRGLLYRERQGRTYRVYPSDDLGFDRDR